MKHTSSKYNELTRHNRWLPVLLVVVVALILGVSPCKGWADDDEDELTLATLKFFIEFNETDEDIGVQAVLGGEPYKRLSAYNPNGRKILDLRPRRGLKMQGMSDFSSRVRSHLSPIFHSLSFWTVSRRGNTSSRP